jgi:prenylcysteine alpha-carboxyl methylesterase
VTVIRNERYGPHERNFLDVFVPQDGAENKPVMMYVHGGGFFAGDKMWTEKVYSNIGWFFAQHGIVTVVVNHRLVPHAQYPDGADDIQLAREWIYQNIASEKYGCGSVDRVVLFGHSSGGAHIAMNLYAAGEMFLLI